MWHYVQRTGALISPHGEIVTHGYAGQPGWKNDPASQCLVDRGPLPRGLYLIAGLINRHRELGKYVLTLRPDSTTQMCGRGDFRIHGDNMAAPGSASKGCIVVAFIARIAVWDSGDRTLRVVADMEDL